MIVPKQNLISYVHLHDKASLSQLSFLFPFVKLLRDISFVQRLLLRCCHRFFGARGAKKKQDTQEPVAQLMEAVHHCDVVERCIFVENS